jgi:hypothetical protein
VGLVATRPGLERRGIGRAVTDALARWAVEEGAVTVALDASAAGRPLYDAMGFDVMGEVRCLAAPAAVPVPGRAATPLLADDVAEVVAFDAAAFGASRDTLVRRLLAEGAPGLVVRDGRGAIDGYALVAPDDGTIGPSAARGEAALAALVAGALATRPVRGCRVLVPPESQHGPALERLGFVETRRLTHMRLPGRPLPGARHLLVSQLSYAVG